MIKFFHLKGLSLSNIKTEIDSTLGESYHIVIHFQAGLFEFEIINLKECSPVFASAVETFLNLGNFCY